jgi:CrcB protein
LTLVRNWAARLFRHRLVLVSLGGAVGTCARYFLTIGLGAPPWAFGFPLGTFVINVSGSFILGVAAVIIRQKLPPEYGYLYLLLGTGFCGGYTTFSSFELETFHLLTTGNWPVAVVYVLASVFAGFVGVILGVALVNRLYSRL